MRLVYLETAKPGLSWFRQYHSDRPELNWAAALASFRTAIETLKSNPFSARKFDDFDEVHERRLLHTAFSILYTVQGDTIFVIDVRDQRGFRSAAALRTFTSELRRKYDLGG